MSALPQKEMTQIESLLDLPAGTLNLEMDTDFGADNKLHRMFLKSDLREKLIESGRDVPEGTDPLKTQGVPISVSHTDELGGFVWINLKEPMPGLQIGLDIENSTRVHEVVAKRICKSEAEFKAAPSPSSLWVAKEAAFKALRGPKQPQVLSEVEITEWTTVDSQIETCCLKDPQKLGLQFSKGLVIRKNAFKICFFISKR